MHNQSALGGRVSNRLPSFNNTRIGRVTSIKDYYKYGRIEVIFLDYSVPMPVWVVGEIDRTPVTGDEVLVGYIDGRKDCPYMIGFVKNQSYTTNFFVLREDKIKLQLPIFGIGDKDGKATKDVQDHLLDNAKQDERAYIELVPDYALVSFPTSEDGTTPPATIKITMDSVEIYHPKDVEIKAGGDVNVAAEGDANVEVEGDAVIKPKGLVKHHNGGKGAARLDDTVQVDVTVDVPGIGSCSGTGTGTITSASAKTLID